MHLHPPLFFAPASAQARDRGVLFGFVIAHNSRLFFCIISTNWSRFGVSKQKTPMDFLMLFSRFFSCYAHINKTNTSKYLQKRHSICAPLYPWLQCSVLNECSLPLGCGLLPLDLLWTPQKENAIKILCHFEDFTCIYELQDVHSFNPRMPFSQWVASITSLCPPFRTCGSGLSL